MSIIIVVFENRNIKFTMENEKKTINYLHALIEIKSKKVDYSIYRKSRKQTQ